MNSRELPQLDKDHVQKTRANIILNSENPTDRGSWWSSVHRITKSWTWLKQLSMHKKLKVSPMRTVTEKGYPSHHSSSARYLESWLVPSPRRTMQTVLHFSQNLQDSILPGRRSYCPCWMTYHIGMWQARSLHQSQKMLDSTQSFSKLEYIK